VVALPEPATSSPTASSPTEQALSLGRDERQRLRRAPQASRWQRQGRTERQGFERVLAVRIRHIRYSDKHRTAAMMWLQKLTWYGSAPQIVPTALRRRCEAAASQPRAPPRLRCPDMKHTTYRRDLAGRSALQANGVGRSVAPKLSVSASTRQPVNRAWQFTDKPPRPAASGQRTAVHRRICTAGPSPARLGAALTPHERAAGTDDLWRARPSLCGSATSEVVCLTGPRDAITCSGRRPPGSCPGRARCSVRSTA
jgi:hypothetical protein